MVSQPRALNLECVSPILGSVLQQRLYMRPQAVASQVGVNARCESNGKSHLNEFVPSRRMLRQRLLVYNYTQYHAQLSMLQKKLLIMSASTLGV